ncbi:hypothetical protein PMAYCL1PPCAC_25717, partial [Pristionchus mayeri]
IRSLQDFHVMLKITYYPDYEIEDEMCLLEALLELGDLYDIKDVIDRVEKTLIKTSKFCAAEKLLFADKHETFRFIKLHTTALGMINTNTWKSIDSKK